MTGLGLLGEMPFLWAAFAAAGFLILGLTQVRRPRLVNQRIAVRSDRGETEGYPYR